MFRNLRNFFLSFFISALVFGVAAYFLVGYVKDMMSITPEVNVPNGDSPPDETSEATIPDETVYDPNKKYHFSILVAGIDSGASQMNAKPEADSIFIVDINSRQKRFMLSPISCDTRVSVRGYMLRLGQVYAEYDLETLMEVVRSLTGLRPEFYLAIDYEGLAKAIEILGPVQYNVPMDMYYASPPEDPNDEPVVEIDLKKGNMNITSEDVLPLLRYKDYSSGNTGRIETHISFIKEVLRQKITFTALGSAERLFNELKSYIHTNFTILDIADYGEMIFNTSSYDKKDISYPGTRVVEYGNIFHNPDISTAIELYRPYRYDILSE